VFTEREEELLRRMGRKGFVGLRECVEDSIAIFECIDLFLQSLSIGICKLTCSNRTLGNMFLESCSLSVQSSYPSQ
jgi:hypothetical protein